MKKLFLLVCTVILLLNAISCGKENTKSPIPDLRDVVSVKKITDLDNNKPSIVWELSEEQINKLVDIIGRTEFGKEAGVEEGGTSGASTTYVICYKDKKGGEKSISVSPGQYFAIYDNELRYYEINNYSDIQNEWIELSKDINDHNSENDAP